MIDWKKRWIVVCAGLALFFAGVIFFSFSCLRHDVSEKEQAGKPKTVKVERRDIADILKLRGIVIAMKKVPILPQASGQITKLFVRKGDLVEKGQPLLEIDPSQLDNRVEKQKLNLEKSEITLKNTKEEYARAQALYKDNYIAEIKLNEIKKNYDISQLDYELAKKELDALKDQLTHVKILAPISGVITAQNVEEGEVVGSSVETTYSKTLFIVTDMKEKKIELLVSDVERSLIKENQPVTFWLDSQAGTRFQGKIAKIDQAASNPAEGSASGAAAPGGSASQNLSFRVEIDILDSSESFALGSNANVEVVLKEAKNVLAIPVEALFREDEKAFVYAAKRSGYEKKQVEPGTSDSHFVEILSGLEEKTVVSLDEPAEN